MMKKTSMLRLSYAIIMVLGSNNLYAVDMANLPADYFTDSVPSFTSSAYPRAVCKTGQPCGNTCISWSYVCHVGTTTSNSNPVTTTPTYPTTNTTTTNTSTNTNNTTNTSFTPTLIDQVITLGVISAIPVGTSTTISVAGGASGNPVLLTSVTPAICSVNNSGLITGLDVGVCTITANQAGNPSYKSALQITKNLNIEAKPVATTANTVKPAPSSCSSASLNTVIDGDTIIISNELGKEEKIRLSQIDAPEKSQPYGVEATLCLENLLKTATISVCRDGTDPYGRTIATVKANGTDVAYPMVSNGCAWAYTQYLEAGSPLPALQQQAQSQKLGLWAAGVASAQAPWLYRAGTQPLPLTATGKTPIAITINTTATAYNRIFDWAEQMFPHILTGAVKNNTTPEGTVYRCYANSFCIGYQQGRILTFDGTRIMDVGGENDILPMVQASGF